jgi:hypothetical protein
MMKCNIGKTDRLLRLIAGVVIIALGAYYKNWWGAIGLIPLVTGLICYCPLYTLIKIDSCGKGGCGGSCCGH